jgi:hypothetical protein
MTVTGTTASDHYFVFQRYTSTLFVAHVLVFKMNGGHMQLTAFTGENITLEYDEGHSEVMIAGGGIEAYSSRT